MEKESGTQPGSTLPKVPKKGSGGTLKKIFKNLTIFLLITGAVMIGLYYYSASVNNSQNSAATNADPNNVNLIGEFNEVAGGNFLEEPYFSQPMSFTINLKDRRRFLKVTFYLGADNPQVLPYIERRLPLINDIIISTIQYKTAEDLQDVLGIERLKAELLSKLNNEVFSSKFIATLGTAETKPIRKIFVTEFILQ